MKPIQLQKKYALFHHSENKNSILLLLLLSLLERQDKAIIPPALERINEDECGYETVFQFWH